MPRLQHRHAAMGLVTIFLIAMWLYSQSKSLSGLHHILHPNSGSEAKSEVPGPNGISPIINKEDEAAKNAAKIADKAAVAAALSELEPCTVVNPTTNRFIDLSSLSSIGNEGKSLLWPAKGFDSGLNFSIGICSTPFKTLHPHEVQDITNSSEVGAFYVDPKTQKYVSLGKYSTEPVMRGRKLTLTYTEGSKCQGIIDSKTGEEVRKSTILSFTCDREMLAKASISYIGSINDCSYFFEVRSHHACPTAAKADNLAVIWIFFFILLAALAVYGSGGFLYKHMKRVPPKI